MNTIDTENRTLASTPIWLRILLISFATLFFEMIAIRWIASEIRIFAFMKNLTLMGCVLGLGIGCSSPVNNDPNKSRLIPFAILLTVLSCILTFAQSLGLTSMSFVFGADVYDWQFSIPTVMSLFVNVVCLLSMFVLIVMLFDFLGQELGKQIAQLPALKGYSFNLLGSLVGVLAFSLMSFLGCPPTLWLGLGLLSLLPLCIRKKEAIIFSLLAVSSVVLAYICVGTSTWTPYYRVDLKPLMFWFKDGYEVQEKFPVGTSLEVNHMSHQAPQDFSKEFFDAHPQLYASGNYLAYNLPYAAKPHPDRVLILGAGSGNDVTVCLQHNPKEIDAVEIDPGILAVGKKVHPQHPYADPRVHPHINDARAFLAGNKSKYDLIVFGHLDSQTALGTISTIRLDNYLYTVESLKSATDHLAENGIAALSFSSQRTWLQARLYQMAKSVYGKDPVVIRTGFAGPGSLAILWGPGLESVRKSLEEKYASNIAPSKELSEPVELSTDDWPFLYQQDRSIPVVYGGMLVVIGLISGWLVFSRFRLTPGSFAANIQFFMLGAGFLLLETRGMLTVASLFGSTWIVNSIVIGLILLMAFVSNSLVERFPKLNENFGYAGLVLLLAVNYFVPLTWFASQELAGRILAATVFIGLPFVFTGIIFSKAFSRSTAPQIALGINILGAILGACLEYSSMITGTGFLTLLAMIIYGISFFLRKAGNTPSV